MTTNEFTRPENLEKYSFLWSEARLVIAAVALLAGGIPTVFLLPIPYGLISMVSSFLTLAWLISGVAAGYLAWRWYTGGQKVFGGTDARDKAAFLVSIVSGINLGLTGFFGGNIGMGFVPYGLTRAIFAITAIVYIAAAFHLWQGWNKHGKKLF